MATPFVTITLSEDPFNVSLTYRKLTPLKLGSGRSH